jgi:hypothetical protein
MTGKTIEYRWLVLLASPLLLSGCATLYADVNSLSEVTSDTVILVGRIEMLPKVEVKEEDIKLGTFDPFNVKDIYRNRAVLHLSDKATKREPTNHAFNPRLEETYFFRVPKDKRYLVYGSIFTYYKWAPVNKYQSVSNTNEIMIPTPVEFDIKPTDKAIYVGTWRFHHDEFNEITKAEILDQYPAVLAEFRKKFGADAVLRKALTKPAQPST